MSHAQKIAVSAFATACIATAAALIALQAIGIGHGSYIPAALLFPFAFLTAFVVHHMDWLLMTLALAQFPIYGVFLGRAWLRERLKKTVIVVVVVHVVAASGCLAAMLIAGWQSALIRGQKQNGGPFPSRRFV
ncbi:MAG: hypothetical protein HY300_09045 [Verrucomicrobia bacterium]|nr:hypothetical protein [Verrucomicrobiota bacterium]